MDIYIFNTKNTDNISNDLLKQFEQKNISDRNKWKTHCLSYLMLDRILKEVYGIQEREIEFINKKPFLTSRKKFFSISHSGDYIALAISDNNCGIDIEQMKDRPIQKIAKRKNFNINSLQEFYYEWTKYEAEYKLNCNYESINSFQYENYTITALSTNPQEKFEILIQNKEIIPNL